MREERVCVIVREWISHHRIPIRSSRCDTKWMPFIQVNLSHLNDDVTIPWCFTICNRKYASCLIRKRHSHCFASHVTWRTWRLRNNKCVTWYVYDVTIILHTLFTSSSSCFYLLPRTKGLWRSDFGNCPSGKVVNKCTNNTNLANYTLYVGTNRLQKDQFTSSRGTS